jgi:hypothetical protein
MDMQHFRDMPRQREEYQPTTYRVRGHGWQLPLILRSALVLVVVSIGALALSMWIGTLLPEPSLFAYEVAARGSDELHLYDTRFHIQLGMHQSDTIRGVKWTPDGTSLIVSDDTREDWYALDLDGARRALRGEEVIGTSYLPAPDWSQYIHVRGEDVLLYDPIRDRDGFVPLLVGVNAREVVWSPDSTKIAVSIGAGDGEARHIGVIDVAAGTWTVATDAPALYARLQWSPDSARLAYIDVPDTIHLYDTLTGHSRDIVSRDRLSVAALAWSPDSSALAYGMRGGPLIVQHLPDGEARVLIERLAEDTRLAWASDGPWLIVRSGNLVEHAVTLVNVDTGRQRRIPLTVSSQGFMAWRP